MSHLLSLSEIQHTLGLQPLFVDLSLQVNSRERIGLVGHNGCGKSTLLRILAGQLQPDSGLRNTRSGLRIALVEQFLPEHIAGLGLCDALLDALPSLRESHESLESDMRYLAEASLDALGFDEKQWQQSVGSLSGGQQNLVLLARAIMSDPDLVLLDEPGNHMDIEALLQLQRWLLETPLAWIMVSHDRALLNATCESTWILRDQRIYRFAQSYDEAATNLAIQDEQHLRQRTLEEKEISRLRASAKRLAIWGRTFDNEMLSRKAKSIEKRATRLESQRTFVSQGNNLALSLPREKLDAGQVLVMENLRIPFPGENPARRDLAECEFLNIRPGERVGLLGVNGCGKSTTIRLLMERLGNQAGTVRWNPRAAIGYYDQELAQLDEAVGRFDWLRARVDGADDPIRQTLLASGVPFASFDQPVHSLSGGERARMMFMLFQLQRPNVLVLDEPTNHIDLEGRETLVETLINGPLTALITSHDRSFLDAVCTRYWIIDDCVIQELNDADRFYEAVQKRVLGSGASSTSPARESVVRPASEVAGLDGSFEDQIDADAALERLTELEALLAADRARKPKHQKPARQKEWQAEIESLWEILD